MCVVACNTAMSARCSLFPKLTQNGCCIIRTHFTVYTYIYHGSGRVCVTTSLTSLHFVSAVWSWIVIWPDPYNRHFTFNILHYFSAYCSANQFRIFLHKCQHLASADHDEYSNTRVGITYLQKWCYISTFLNKSATIHAFSILLLKLRFPNDSIVFWLLYD